ncbi:MAG: HD domain-containing protein [Deltaproteobacteria bacterium]|nr:HD domain-containing protein [Deltaproteobacteria bacterium]
MTGEELNLERLIFNLNALAELGEEITSQKDFQRVIKSSLYMVMGTFSASRGAIFVYDHEKMAVYPVVSKGIVRDRNISIPMSAALVGEMTRNKGPVLLRGKGKLVKLLHPVMDAMERMSARIIIPLVVKDEFHGFITINEKFSGEGFTPSDLRLLCAMAKHIAVSLHTNSLLKKLMHRYNENKGLYEELRTNYYNTIYAFAAAIDAKDAYTNGHSHRVSAYSTAVAKELGLPADDIEGIRIGGLLHDIGKLAVDKTIINKAAMLTTVEHIEINTHPVVGYDILSKIRFPWKGVARMARSHHERPDGGGYPDGLKTDNIPLESRIMALVDAFDAMTTDRPYRKRLSFAHAVTEIRKYLGIQFDPQVVRPFLFRIRREVNEEVEHPSIVPLLLDHLDAEEVIRLVDNVLAA